MGLVEEQDLFLQHVPKLLAHAHALGFVVTGGELFRTPEQQRIHIREGRSQTMTSQHLKRLAIDLNFFVRKPGGELSLCYDQKQLQPLGDFWEALDPANRWGGNWNSFKDTPHFERRDGAAPPATPETRTTPVSGRRGIGLLGSAVGAKQPNLRTDVEAVQRLLNHAAGRGHFVLDAPLKPDGIYGEKTSKAIFACQRDWMGVADPDGVVSPDKATVRRLCDEIGSGYSKLLLSLTMLAAADEQVDRFAEPIGRCLDRFDISSPTRQAHFLAQIGHESGELRFQEEIASGAAYEGRQDLGNVRPGDGTKFKGRGLIQLTGRYNYQKFGAAIGREDELLETPEIVATDLDLCVQVAGWFWSSNGLNALADTDDLTAVTRKINGGTNGIEQRKALLTRAKALFGLN